MQFNPTLEQSDAIESSENTLVSAAAGSGKTAVLVARVIKKMCDPKNPLNVDRMLIVTFTNAAAAELRLRIEKALNEELDHNPYSSLLQRQKIMLPNAKISTIDSFCIDFVRENFELAGIDPSFKIISNSDYKMLLSSVISQIIEEEFNSGNTRFLELLEYIGADYDDSKLFETINKIFSYSRQMPYPDRWIEGVCKFYEDFAEGKNRVCFDDVFSEAKIHINDAYTYISKSLEALECNLVAYEKYIDNISYLKELCEKLTNDITAKNWDNVYDAVSTYKAPSFKSLSAKNKDESSNYAAAMRDCAKSEIEALKQFFYTTESNILDEVKEAIPHINKMSELVLSVSSRFEEEMRTRGFMTFAMVEQTALQILTRYKDGKIVAADGIDRFIGQFDEVLVDEYQDTNDLQDTLFNVISDNQKKLFCVGDAKQSIYRFRGANPNNFIKKKKIYKYRNDENRFGLRVDLSGNFRSRREICDYVNGLFSFIMHEDTADIEYDEREMLKPLEEFSPNKTTKVETNFIDLNAVDFDANGIDEPDDKIKAIKAEGRVIAKLIRDTINSEPFIHTKAGLRKAEYDDIAILMRSPANRAQIIAEEIRSCGIPVALPGSAVFETDEVKTLMALLSVINNPRDDIAMLTVLTSPIYGFTLDEIAGVKGAYSGDRLVSALTMAEDNAKVASFLAELSEYRHRNVMLKVSALIDEIFERTNFIGIVSRMDDGEIRKQNLLTVKNIAEEFESEGKRDLRDFITVVDSIDDNDAKADKPFCKNAVRIMTIHSSKGLQYPVCILADTGRDISFIDLKNTLLIDEHYGFSFKYFDADSLNNQSNLLRILMSDYARRKTVAEEIRLLYVALTRAEDKLLITGCFSNLKKMIDGYRTMNFVENGRMTLSRFKAVKNFAEWIFANEFFRGADPYLAYLTKDIKPDNVYTDLPKTDSFYQESDSPDQVLADRLKENYAYVYPYADLLMTEAKATVTEIVHKADMSKYEFTSRPAFMNEGGSSGAEKGRSTHKFMEFCDYDAAEKSVSDECNRLYENGYLTEQEAESVDRGVIDEFFHSDLYCRIRNSADVRREMNFLSEFPARAIKRDLPEQFADEKIIVQGAVDLMFAEDDGLVIVDFKTDRNKEEQDLKEAYAEQLKLYGRAVELLYKKPVKELYIYSFSLKREIKL